MLIDVGDTTGLAAAVGAFYVLMVGVRYALRFLRG